MPVNLDERSVVRAERTFRLPDVPQCCPRCHVEMFSFCLLAELGDRTSTPSTIYCACGATIHVEPGYRPPLPVNFI